MSLVAKLRSGGLGRAVWNLADQVVCSVNNALLAFVVANAFPDDASQFGAFSIAFTVFSIVVGLSRALATTPVSIKFAGEAPAVFRPAATAALGTAVALGAAAGVVSAVVGSLLGGALGTALVAFGVVLPGLLLQDSWRQVFFALQRPAAAALMDVTFAVLQVGALVVLLRGEHPTVVPFVLAWGGSALLASVLGMVQLRLLPRLQDSGRWVRDQWELTRYLVPEFVVLQAGAQLAVLVVAAIGSQADAGYLRAANILTGPATIMATGLMSYAIPELSRRRDGLGVRGWRLAALPVSGAVLLTGLAWGVLVLLLPDAAGRFLLEDVWEGASGVLLPIIVGQAGAALSVGPAAVLYGMERAAVTFRIHVVYAVLVLVLSAGGAVLGGAVGAAWGGAIAFWVVVPSWFVAVHRQSAAAVAAREPDRSDEVAEGSAPSAPA
ncbi:hypothetical protein [Kineococcus glutinatus]|uniref:O-antigen/teichoic acid export membrane protein n=1 Tax=Kineococcus glutinatus TaxID=1070872 RepID=A0ABP8VB95_9ACTN